MCDLEAVGKHSRVLTILNGGWRQHKVADADRADTAALLTGAQEQAVKHHHLVPKVILALVNPGQWGKKKPKKDNSFI